MYFTEDFLHFIWQFRLFISAKKLYCTTGESIEVLCPGTLNRDAGPDFSQAKLRIGQTIWSGNVEIHIRSSDWFLHNHQHDAVYDSIILHVIYEDNTPVYRTNGSRIPSLVLKDLFPAHLLDNYTNLISSVNLFPCEKQIGSVDAIFINGFLSRLMAERLEQRSADLYRKLKAGKGDWDGAFYHFIAKNFGFKVNSLPFELLVTSIPQRIFARHKDHPIQVEALIFGQAGFLQQTFTEKYPQQLKKEYLFLQKKYQLKPIDVSLWKFLRMRPRNFPTVRLAQFAALIISSKHLFSKIIEISHLQDFYGLFEKLSLNPYWQTHYHFGKQTRYTSNQLGRLSIQNLITNTICLFLFAYGKYTDNELLMDRAFDLLEQLPAEKNAILKKYQLSGISVTTAFQSQSVLQLNKNYCTQKKCLNCVIGIKILKR